MATAQVALVPICDGCQQKDSRWFCDDCQINLCDQCKNIHQRGPKTKNDTIIPIGQVQQDTQGKIAPVLCDTHVTKLCELYCHTCKQLICAQCSISSNHKSHSFNGVETIIVSKVSELNSIEKNFKGKLSSYETVLANEGKAHVDYMMHIDHLEVKVKNQTDKIVKEFYRLRDKQLSELLTLKKEEEKRYRAECNKTHSRLTDIKKTIESVQKAKVSGNAAVIIQVVKETTQLYQSLGDSTTSDLPRPEFEYNENPETHHFLQLQGRLNLPSVKVKKVQGAQVIPTPQREARIVLPKHKINMNNVRIKLRIKIKGKTEFINFVVPIGNNMAWLVVQPDKHLSLVDTEGTVVKESAEVDGVIFEAVSYDEDILIRHAGSHYVMRVRKDGDSVTTFSDLSPFYPNGLCVTSQQDVMVSLISSVPVNSTSTSKVVRLDRQGHVTQEIQYRNEKPLFTCAFTMISLPSGDVVVRDCEAEDVYTVVCVDESGNYRYTWSGEVGGRKVDNFTPTILAHDGQKVYITDMKNHCVYVLDRHGRAQQFMLDKLGITQPVAISIDNKGRMWIGCVANIYVLE